MRPLAAGLFALLMAAAPPTLRADDQAVKALLDKAAKAQGGANNVAMLAELSLKCKGQLTENGNNIEMAFDLSVRQFDHVRMEMSVNEGGKLHRGIIVFAGDKGWFRDLDRDKVEDAPAEARSVIQSILFAIRSASSPVLLGTNKSVELAHGGESKVDDAAVEVLRISRKDQPDITLYIDKKSGLPLKSETQIKTPGGEDKNFTFRFTDFKDFDGVKHFTKIKVNDGKMDVELELSDLKPSAKFEANTFDKP
jgi:hypothetical protein